MSEVSRLIIIVLKLVLFVHIIDKAFSNNNFEGYLTLLEYGSTFCIYSVVECVVDKYTYILINVKFIFLHRHMQNIFLNYIL